MLPGCSRRPAGPCRVASPRVNEGQQRAGAVTERFIGTAGGSPYGLRASDVGSRRSGVRVSAPGCRESFRALAHEAVVTEDGPDRWTSWSRYLQVRALSCSPAMPPRAQVVVRSGRQRSVTVTEGDRCGGLRLPDLGRGRRPNLPGRQGVMPPGGSWPSGSRRMSGGPRPGRRTRPERLPGKDCPMCAQGRPGRGPARHRHPCRPRRRRRAAAGQLAARRRHRGAARPPRRRADRAGRPGSRRPVTGGLSGWLRPFSATTRPVTMNDLTLGDAVPHLHPHLLARLAGGPRRRAAGCWSRRGAAPAPGGGRSPGWACRAGDGLSRAVYAGYTRCR
jgi:hypothetical protein